MTTTEFFTYVRALTRANDRDLSNADIEILANPQADFLYELTIQGYQLEQTANATPTVYNFNMVTDFQITEQNLWIERVEVSVDGGESHYELKRTNKTEYNAYLKECNRNRSLTDDLVEDADATHFIQTSQGIHVFPVRATGMDVVIYVKDTPSIDWGNPAYEILLPNVPVNLLALKTALMYRDIEDTNRLEWLQGEYNEKFRAFEKRIAKGGRVIQMRMVTKELI